MQLDDLEKLALAQAIYKVVSEAVSTKNPDSLRSIVDGRIMDSYVRDGVKSRDMRINGEKVGTYTVRVSEEKVKDYAVIEDTPAFAEWIANNPELATQFAMAESVLFIDFVLAETGELPSGVEMHRDVYPAGPVGTTLRIDVEKVAQVMGANLPNAVAGLIGGGVNG